MQRALSPSRLAGLLAIAAGLGVAIGAGLSRWPSKPLKRVVAEPQEATSSQAASRRSEALVACYGLRLGQFSESLREFRAAKIDDIKSLTQAASLLIPTLINTNNAFADIEQQRTFLTAQILRSSPGSKAAHYSCMLEYAEQYQWDVIRGAVNKRLVALIAAWEDMGSASQRKNALALAIKEHATSWGPLQSAVDAGAKRFSLPLPNPCPAP